MRGRTLLLRLDQAALSGRGNAFFEPLGVLSTPLVNSIVFGLRPIRFGQKPEESGMNACKEMKTFRRDRRYLADGSEHELACQCKRRLSFGEFALKRSYESEIDTKRGIVAGAPVNITTR